MRLSALKVSFCVSLIIHGVIFVIVTFAGSGHTININIPAKRDELALQIVTESESIVPVVAKQSSLPATPTTTSIEPVLIEPMASPTIETQQSAPAEVIPDKPPFVSKMISEKEPQASSGLDAPVGDQKTNALSISFPARYGESKCSPPGYVSNPQPIYPKEALNRKQEGLVVLNVLVTYEGKAESVKMLHSSGYILLDEAAIRAVKQWRFTPARTGSTPVSAEVELPIRFKLSSGYLRILPFGER
jgi:protein TonB